MHQSRLAEPLPVSLRPDPPCRSSLFQDPRNLANSSLLPNNPTLTPELVNGLRNLPVTLDPGSSVFAAQLVSLLLALHVPTWSVQRLDPVHLRICKASGSLTNAVYFVSYPPLPSIPTILLRIYGPSSGSLFSRSHELHILHILSSRYHIGPRIYGTFANGRIEEYFDSVTLGPLDLRDEKISRWIAARMAEFHSVEITTVEGPLAIKSQEGKSWEIGVKKNVKAWLPIARQVLAHPNLAEIDRAILDLDTFLESWVRYLRWLSQVERVEGPSRRVFAHNDTQYGNLLRLAGDPADGTPEHHQLVVVDFEYASPNPLAFDIANHFHEWTADYHSSAPHLLDASRYPTAQQRRHFYHAYLSHARIPSKTATTEVASEARLRKLEREVSLWSPASHGMWAIWGIVQAKDDLERGRRETQAEFDYIEYAKCRMQTFFEEIATIGV